MGSSVALSERLGRYGGFSLVVTPCRVGPFLKDGQGRQAIRMAEHRKKQHKPKKRRQSQKPLKIGGFHKRRKRKTYPERIKELGIDEDPGT